MTFKKPIAVSVVVSLFFLFTAMGFCAEDGRVTMEQWIKIINARDANNTPLPQATEPDSRGAVDSAMPVAAQGTAVTIYWHMADDADVYLNGNPLRDYRPSFKTRPDEAPQPAFSTTATLREGDVFTVGGRRGGSFGFMLVAVDSENRIVFQTDQESWKVYEPGNRPDWYAPHIALASPAQPVTVQPNPWHPQKELNAKYGNKALSIWSKPDRRFAYLYGIVNGNR